MKIRCEQNSLRLRLRRSELVQLRAEKWLEAAVHFPDGRKFTWELMLEDNLPEMATTFDGARISVRVPGEMAHKWIESNAVHLESFLPVGEGATLHVLVEKDFPCKDRPEEDKTDFFADLAEEAPANC